MDDAQAEERERRRLEKAQRSAAKLARKDNSNSSTKKKKEGGQKPDADATLSAGGGADSGAAALHVKRESKHKGKGHHAVERVESGGGGADSDDSGFGDEDHLEALYTPSKESGADSGQNGKKSASTPATPAVGGTPRSASLDASSAAGSAAKKQADEEGANELSAVKLRPTGASPDVKAGEEACTKPSAEVAGKGGDDAAAAPVYADPGEMSLSPSSICFFFALLSPIL